jgi:hypothetical protein
MFKQAKTLLDSGDLDGAEQLIDSLTKMLKARHRVTVEHDDTDYQDVSNPAASDTENNSDNDGEDDEEEDDDLQKSSINEVLRTHSDQNRPGSLSESKHPSSSNARHKFEALVNQIKNENRRWLTPAPTSPTFSRAIRSTPNPSTNLHLRPTKIWSPPR